MIVFESVSRKTLRLAIGCSALATLLVGCANERTLLETNSWQGERRTIFVVRFAGNGVDRMVIVPSPVTGLSHEAFAPEDEIVFSAKLTGGEAVDAKLGPGDWLWLEPGVDPVRLRIDASVITFEEFEPIGEALGSAETPEEAERTINDALRKG